VGCRDTAAAQDGANADIKTTAKTADLDVALTETPTARAPQVTSAARNSRTKLDLKAPTMTKALEVWKEKADTAMRFCNQALPQGSFV
jgi:hypothetical protein